MRWRLLELNWQHWRKNYRQRLHEVVFWRKHEHAWQSGYGASRPGLLEYSFEAAVRIAELLGIGLVFALFESLFAGGRFRSLTRAESAFAKTYFADVELDMVLLDEGAKWIAKPLRIAYVAGVVIKTHGPFSSRLLIHELVHVRQFRRWGWAYTAKALMAQWTGDGYAVPAQLAFSRADINVDHERRRTLRTFHPALNAEQEARRLEQWVMGDTRFGVA